MTSYLSLDEVLVIHDDMLEVGGGNEGINNFTLFHSAVERAKATFGGKDLYPTIWEKAAALLHSLIKNHPFNDGNKRTAFFSTVRFLKINNYIVKTDKNEGIKFLIKIDLSKTIKLKDITSWLRSHSKKTYPLQ